MILKSEPLASRLKRSLGGWCDFLGLGWIAAIWKLNPAASVWLLPVAIPFVLSIPLSVDSSRIALGRAARRGDYL